MALRLPLLRLPLSGVIAGSLALQPDAARLCRDAPQCARRFAGSPLSHQLAEQQLRLLGELGIGEVGEVGLVVGVAAVELAEAEGELAAFTSDLQLARHLRAAGFYDAGVEARRAAVEAAKERAEQLTGATLGDELGDLGAEQREAPLSDLRCSRTAGRTADATRRPCRTMRTYPTRPRRVSAALVALRVRALRFDWRMTSAVTPPTSLQLLRGQVEEVREVFGRLLDHTQLRYGDINARSSGAYVVGWSPHRWAPPMEGAQRYFGEARQTWQSLHDLAAQAVRRSAPERIAPLDDADELLRRIFEQDDGWYGAPGKTVDEIRARVDRCLQEVVELLEGLPAAHGEGGQLLVPDTNALVFKPDLESWRPPEGAWTVVLVRQVLRELDALKMRRGEVGEKAASVIRRVKEYARRGDTFKGVPVAGSLSLREIAIDADMTDTLPWLRVGHGDDELLASVLELRCQDLNAVVALATRDRNLQNKARLARCAYLDVEDEL